MKTLKVLSFIFLAVTVIFVFAISAGSIGELNEYEEYYNKSGPPVNDEFFRYSEHNRTIINLGGALGILALSSPVFGIISLIVAITNRKKYYEGFITGFLQLIPLLVSIWALIEVKSLAADLGYYSVQRNNYFGILNYGPIKAAVYMLLIPTVIQLLDGTIKTIRHKKGKDITQESENSAKYLANRIIENIQPKASNAAQIKEYKELLDIGAITHSEYEAKKKELLGLPNTYNVPVQQNIGKCMACGRENVLLESVNVNIAGTLRKRTMCNVCAAKYRSHNN